MANDLEKKDVQNDVKKNVKADKDKAKKGAKVKKAKKKRMSPKQYIKNTIAELKRVNWPTRKELLSYTAAVIVFVVIVCAITSLIDLGLSQGLNAIIAS